MPRAEVDNWQDVDPILFARCSGVAQKIGQGQQRAFDAPRVGLIIAGLEVPHLHLHVIPIWQMADLDFARANHNPKPSDLDDAAERLRGALRELGYSAEVPAG
jgi:diadenosine tetraphosphate (Ap4A) HIT family hydrolase